MSENKREKKRENDNLQEKLTTSSGSSGSIRSFAGKLRDWKSMDAACAILRLIACFVASATRSASNKASTVPS